MRGLRDFKKRKSLVNWLAKQKADIIFLQETYSTPEIENDWKYQWKGDIFFAHGTNKSKGTLILIKNDLDFEAKNVKTDKNGRFVLIKAVIQNSPFILVNVYAPNDTKEQINFFSEINYILEDLEFDPDSNIVIGGDFNVTFDTDLDCSGGKPVLKESVKKLKEIEANFDLIDIWRIRNPEVKRFTWRQKNRSFKEDSTFGY